MHTYGRMVDHVARGARGAEAALLRSQLTAPSPVGPLRPTWSAPPQFALQPALQLAVTPLALLELSPVSRETLLHPVPEVELVHVARVRVECGARRRQRCFDGPRDPTPTDLEEGNPCLSPSASSAASTRTTSRHRRRRPEVGRTRSGTSRGPRRPPRPWSSTTTGHPPRLLCRCCSFARAAHAHDDSTTRARPPTKAAVLAARALGEPV